MRFMRFTWPTAIAGICSPRDLGLKAYSDDEIEALPKPHLIANYCTIAYQTPDQFLILLNLTANIFSINLFFISTLITLSLKQEKAGWLFESVFLTCNNMAGVNKVILVGNLGKDPKYAIWKAV